MKSLGDVNIISESLCSYHPRVVSDFSKPYAITQKAINDTSYMYG